MLFHAFHSIFILLAYSEEAAYELANSQKKTGASCYPPKQQNHPSQCRAASHPPRSTRVRHSILLRRHIISPRGSPRGAASLCPVSHGEKRRGPPHSRAGSRAWRVAGKSAARRRSGPPRRSWPQFFARRLSRSTGPNGASEARAPATVLSYMPGIARMLLKSCR